MSGRRKDMVQVLLSYLDATFGPDGRMYQPRACGAATEDGRWQGWLEFVPADRSTLLRSPLETIQLNRQEMLRWASQLTSEYLEAAMQRALALQTAPPPLQRAS